MRKKNYWDDISGSYDKNYRSSWSLSEDNEIASLLSSVGTVGTPIRALDLGCGTGLGYKILHKQFAELKYVGVDASSKMLDEAKSKTAAFASERTQIRLEHSDAMSFLQKTRDNEFDIVLALNATGSYIARTRPLFKQCARVLRPGGSGLLSFLNRYSVRRIFQHYPCSIKEQSVSRGEFQSSLSIPAVTLRKRDVVARLTPLQPEYVKLHYQSILGGVWETDRSLEAERLLKRFIPSFGHTVNVLFRTKEAE